MSPDWPQMAHGVFKECKAIQVRKTRQMLLLMHHMMMPLRVAPRICTVFFLQSFAYICTRHHYKQ